jgi:hypothetical protein
VTAGCESVGRYDQAMVRRWCVALVLAIALGAGAFVARGPVLTAQDVPRELDRGGHAALTVPPHDARVDLVLPARRVVPEGSAKPLLQALATLSAACGIAFAAVVLRRRWARADASRLLLRVPCGLRAPPSLHLA